MRRRLKKFLPIVLIAALVQIFAPIGATWAATIAAADPLHAVPICHGATASIPDQPAPSGQPSAHDGCCSVCSVVHSGAPVDAPQAVPAEPFRPATSVVVPGLAPVAPPQAMPTEPFRPATSVVWPDTTPDLFVSRPGSHAQARAPPA